MNSGWKPGQGRRNRNSGKGLDDVLGDLLGGDDSPPTKPSQTWPGKSTKPAPKKRGNDEDFYSSLAADYDEEESDVSAADPDEMAKTLNDLDDMDADLFGPSKKKATPKKSQPPANKPTPVNKPTPAKTKEPDFSFDDGPSSPVAAPAPKVSSSPAAKPKAKSYDFGDFDEDDPLAGLLSDDEDDKPKKKPAAKKAPLKKEPQVDIEKSDDRPGTSRGRKPIEKTAPQKTVKDDLFSDDDDGLAGLGDSPPPKPKEQPKPVKSKKDVLNFDDDSDPLAGLDDSPRKEKPKPKKTKKDEINFSDDDDPLASLDEKPKNVKPASKSGGRKKNDDLDFDDGDVLGTMGFDDSPRKSKDDDDDDAPKGRSMLDSLLGKDSVSKHLEKPAPSQKREFVLDDKYRKKDNVAKEKKVVEPSEDDFNFGDYMPSAAATMKPSGSKRSVRFQEGDDDDFFGLSTYPAARGGARRGRGGISATLDDDGGDDWLSMASGTSSDKPKTTSPPESKKEPKKKSTADSMDWLGLGDSVKETKTEDSSDWLGRPSNKKAETKLQSGGDAMESPRRPQEKTPASPHAKKPSTLTKQNSRDNNDWLGLGNEVEKEPPASKDRDWLGIGDSSLSPDKSESGDWLGYAAKKPQEKEEKGFSDWLGIKDTPTKKPQEKTAASPRTQKSATLKKENSKDTTDDWLGLGKDVEPEAPVTQPSPRPPRADERGLDLFSPPKKQQSASSLPWETGKSKQTPQPSASTPLAQPLSSSTPLPQKVPDPPHAQSVPNLSTPTPQSNVASQMEQLQKMQQEQDRMYQENLKKQEEALVEAQRQAMIQQQEQQAALQRQIQEQQELQMKMKSEQIQQQMQEQQRKMQEETMRMEQQFKEQQLKQQQQMQQQQMQQQLQQQQQQQQMLQQPSLLNTSQLPGLGMSAIFSPQQHMVNMEVTQQRALADNTIAGLELETKVRKLEIERDHLQSMLESIKLRHADEISAIDASNKSKLSIIEESFQRREMRLKEENELLAGQNLSKVRQIEEEKSKMVSEQFAKYAEWEREKNQEIERLKELHKNSLETMRKDHEEAVERLRKVKDQEIAAASSGHEHSKSMQVVLEQMQMNTRDLGHLQYKISNHHTAGLDDREITMRAKDEKLSVMEERLLKQQEENDKERIRLQELVAKMELQIREQGRQLEEERWRVKKEQSRLDALQHSLEEETRINTERVTRERRELQKAREDLLTEQKSILSQLYEERRVLSSERAEFNVSQRLLLNREQSDSFRTVKASAELEGTLNKLAEDKAHIGTRMEELKMETERIASERTLLEQEKLKLADEQEKLSQLALQLKQRSAEVEQMSVEAARVHSEGTQALAKAKATESGHHVQLYEAEAKIETLRKKERQIAQERLAIAKERRQLQNVQNSLTCQSCRTPVKDTATALADYNSAHGHPQVSRLLPMSQTPVVDLVNDRQTRIKVWQISAEKDKEFLADESLFLESLKYSPYSSQNIAS